MFDQKANMTANVEIIRAIPRREIIKPARHILDFIKKKLVAQESPVTAISATRQGTAKVASPTGAPK